MHVSDSGSRTQILTQGVEIGEGIAFT